jgi:hypothetical protein
MVELNIIYKLVFCEYRDLWFLLNNIKNGKRVDLYHEESKIEQSLNNVQDQFNRAGGSFKGNTSGGWAFKHMENICFYMSDAIDLLIKINKKRNNTINYHNLEILKKNVEQIADRILKYPDFKPDGCVDVKKN